VINRKLRGLDRKKSLETGQTVEKVKRRKKIKSTNGEKEKRKKYM
jgi:hypothetical protein